eukprot:5985780-Amphidinium_carterae.1
MAPQCTEDARSVSARSHFLLCHHKITQIYGIRAGRTIAGRFDAEETELCTSPTAKTTPACSSIFSYPA